MNHLILIPSYKPDPNFFNLIQKFLLYKNINIIVINNGNDLKYKKYFNKIESLDRCLVINVEINYGKGNGIKKAIPFILNKFKDTGYVIFADADGQHTYQDIGVFLKKIKNLSKNYFIIGNRLHNKNTPIKNLIGNKIYNFILRKKFKFTVKDALCGLRAIHYSNLNLLLEIKENEFEFEVETIKKIHINKLLKIEEINISSTYFKNHKSHFSTIKDSFKLIKFIFNIDQSKINKG